LEHYKVVVVVAFCKDLLVVMDENADCNSSD